MLQALTFLVKALLVAEANPNERTLSNETPLHLAAACLDLKMIEMLVNFGSSLTAVDFNGNTPLLTSLLNDNPILVQSLVLLLCCRPSTLTAVAQQWECTDFLCRMWLVL